MPITLGCGWLAGAPLSVVIMAVGSAAVEIRLLGSRAVRPLSWLDRTVDWFIDVCRCADGIERVG